MAEPSPALREAASHIDPDRIEAAVNNTVWRRVFLEHRHDELLTLNQVCRLLLGPHYFPDRSSQSYNANIELLVRGEDIAAWVPIDVSENEWLSLADYDGGEHPDDAQERDDANKLALRTIRQLLHVTGALQLRVAGQDVAVELTPEPSAKWPRPMQGLDEAEDGPWPPPLHARCTWNGGATTLTASVGTWNPGHRYGDQCGANPPDALTGTGTASRGLPCRQSMAAHLGRALVERVNKPPPQPRVPTLKDPSLAFLGREL
jgi:hypothetical protein